MCLFISHLLSQSPINFQAAGFSISEIWCHTKFQRMHKSIDRKRKQYNSEVGVFRIRVVIGSDAEQVCRRLRGQLEIEHLNCFPNLGQIRINKLMVKRKSCFYCLPDSFPIKNAFQGVKKGRSIHIDATALTSINKTGLDDPKCQQILGHTMKDAQLTDSSDPVCRVTSIDNDNVSVKRKWFPIHLEKGLENGNMLGEANIADKHRGERSTCSQMETGSDTLSVSNIIKKYFDSDEEVNSDSEIKSGTLGTKSASRI